MAIWISTSFRQTMILETFNKVDFPSTLTALKDDSISDHGAHSQVLAVLHFLIYILYGSISHHSLTRCEDVICRTRFLLHKLIPLQLSQKTAEQSFFHRTATMTLSEHTLPPKQDHLQEEIATICSRWRNTHTRIPDRLNLNQGCSVGKLILPASPFPPLHSGAIRP